MEYMSQTKIVYKKLNLTARGYNVLACSLVFSFLGIFFRDFFIVILGLSLGFVIAYIFFQIRSTRDNIANLIFFQHKSLEHSITAGESYYGTINVKSAISSNVTVLLNSPFAELSFESSVIGNEDTTLGFVFQPQLAGEYSSYMLRLDVFDRFRIVEGLGVLPIEFYFLVYPRVMEVAVEAVSFLLEAGGMGLWDQPTQIKGNGLEYAESRLYVTGDPMKRMDWKATARLGRLAIKDYYIEGGLKNHIIYEASTPDPISTDVLLSSFFRTILAYAKITSSLGLTIYNRTGVHYHGLDIPSRLAVYHVMRYALKGVEWGFHQLFDVLDPKAVVSLERLLGRLEASSSWNSKGLVKEVGLIREKIPNKNLIDFLDSENNMTQLLVVTSLTDDILPILELARSSRKKGWKFHVLQPTKPWLQSSDLEDSYRLWKNHIKLKRVFRQTRINMVTSVEEIYQEVPSHISLTRSHI